MLIALLLLSVTSVLAQEVSEEQVLGVCAMYKFAFPSGHTEADLEAVFLDHLPASYAELILEQGVPDLSTSDFVEMYESQREFCEEHEAEIMHVLLEAQSEGELSTESEEMLHTMTFESVALLSESTSQAVATTERRRTFLLVAAVVLIGTAGVKMVAYTMMGICFAAILGGIGYSAVGMWGAYGPDRRLLRSGAPQALTTATRRALTIMPTLEIPTMEIISACNNNIASFVCSLSTMALTQVVTSQFCGGSNLNSCLANFQYAVGFVNAIADGAN